MDSSGGAALGVVLGIFMGQAATVPSTAVGVPTAQVYFLSVLVEDSDEVADYLMHSVPLEAWKQQSLALLFMFPAAQGALSPVHIQSGAALISQEDNRLQS